MPFSKVLNAVTFIDHSIRNKTSRKAIDIAKHLGISERQVFNYLKAMKSEGAPIAYCRKTYSYHYTEPGYFYFGFVKNNSSSPVKD